jgi:hypothetical protein
MAKTYAVRPSVRVRGVTYRSPTEAYVAADELEHDAERRAAAARANGDEAFAEKIVDNARRDGEQLRTWGRQREEFEARSTAQPPGVPNEPPQAPRAPAGRRRSPPPRRRSAPSSRRRSGLFGGRSGSLARRGYARSGAQAQVRSAGTLGYKIAGATIGIALLTLFLTDRGSGAFADLTGFAAASLKLVVDPVDPLHPGLLDSYMTQAQRQNLPAVPLTPGRSTTAPARTQLASRRLPANRRRSSRGVLA